MLNSVIPLLLGSGFELVNPDPTSDRNSNQNGVSQQAKLGIGLEPKTTNYQLKDLLSIPHFFNFPRSSKRKDATKRSTGMSSGSFFDL